MASNKVVGDSLPAASPQPLEFGWTYDTILMAVISLRIILTILMENPSLITRDPYVYTPWVLELMSIMLAHVHEDSRNSSTSLIGGIRNGSMSKLRGSRSCTWAKKRCRRGPTFEMVNRLWRPEKDRDSSWNKQPHGYYSASS